MVARADGTFDDVRGFGHVQATFRLDLGTKLDVFEARVVVQARVCGQIRAGQFDDHGVLRRAGGRERPRPARTGPRR